MTLESIQAKWGARGFEAHTTWWKYNKEVRLSVTNWKRFPFVCYSAQMPVQKKKHVTPKELFELERSISVQYWQVEQ